MAFGGCDDATTGGQGSALGKANNAARVGGEQLRATFPRTWEEVVAEEQPGTCPEACWELGWEGWGWELGWKARW